MDASASGASELRVAHLDADAFYVSIELGRRPELRGLPVVVAGTGPRAVVTTASYEARRFGVGSAMPASRARRLCPQAVFLPPGLRHLPGRLGADDGDRPRARRAASRWSGSTRPTSTSTGLFSPRAAMRRLRRRDQRGGRASRCSVGIGPNKLVAKVASDAEKPAGFVVLTREQACARFAASPPEPRPGDRPEDGRQARGDGLRARSARSPRHPSELLAERFGPNLGRDLRAARALRARRRSSAARKVVSESRERTFDTRHQRRRRDARRRCARWRWSSARASPRNGRAGRTIGIKVRLDDWTTVTRAHTLPAPTRDGELVAAEALRLLAEYAPAASRAAARRAGGRACSATAVRSRRRARRRTRRSSRCRSSSRCRCRIAPMTLVDACRGRRARLSNAAARASRCC